MSGKMIGRVSTIMAKLLHERPEQQIEHEDRSGDPYAVAQPSDSIRCDNCCGMSLSARKGPKKNAPIRIRKMNEVVRAVSISVLDQDRESETAPRTAPPAS